MAQRPIQRIVRTYRGITRLYSLIRFAILRQTFLQEIGQYLPREGRVLDLGAGFGLFSLYFALTGKRRELVGVDLSADRVAMARRSAGALGLQNVRYECADVVHWKGEGDFDAIYLLDLIHHLPAAEVPGFLRKVRDHLRPGGTLLIKDIADRPTYKRWFTLLLDRLMVGFEPIRYWPPAELSALLDQLGFQVKRHSMKDILPFPHLLYVCQYVDDDGCGDPDWLRSVTE